MPDKSTTIAGVESIVSEDTKIQLRTATEDDKQSKKEQYDLFTSASINDQVQLRKIDMIALDRKHERVLRKKNANRSFWFSVGWACFIASIIFFKGFGHLLNFKLSTTEFLSVIGALSITILTYYTLVIKSLFPSNNKDLKE